MPMVSKVSSKAKPATEKESYNDTGQSIVLHFLLIVGLVCSKDSGFRPSSLSSSPPIKVVIAGMEILSEEFTASFNTNVAQDSRGDLSKDFAVYEKKASEAREKTLKEGTISEGLAEVAEVDTLKFWFAQVRCLNLL